MTQKSKHIELADKLIMAPWKYMNLDGSSPSKSFLLNLVHKPETKITLLAGVSVAALNISLESSIMNLIYPAVVVAVYGLSSKFMRPPAIKGAYIDTNPETEVKLGEGSKALLSKVKKGVFRNLFSASAAGALSTGIVNYLTPQDMSIVQQASNFLAISTYIFSRDASQDYRIERLIQGHWSLSAGSAPREPELEKTEFKVQAPALAPVRS